MYDSMVVANRRHKVYDCLVGVSWSVEPGLKRALEKKMGVERRN